jgi:cyanate permease
MKPWERWVHALAGVAGAVAAVSSLVAAVRQGSWEPLIAVAWLPAVVVATWWPGTQRRCAPRRQGSPG